MARTPVAERFWKYVDRSGGPEACWLWVAYRGPQGYGRLYDPDRSPQVASRVSWEIHHGPIPDGLWVCHRCDNPPCVNPAHLFLGDDAANMADKSTKGRARGNRTRGERHPTAKLTDAQVTEMVAAYAAGGIGQRALAQRYGVTQACVSLLVRGERR